MARCLMEILVLVVLTLKDHSANGYSAGSLIWNRDNESFVPLWTVARFQAERLNYLVKSRELETHNFNTAQVILAYYEETNIVDFYDNDTRIGGICGELWNMLSSYLNFTMVMIKVDEHNYGTRQKNGSYDGLVGMLVRNEVQIIPRTGFYAAESKIMAFTTPIWDNTYKLYIRPEFTADTAWMLKMFSRRVWCSILLLFLLLSVLGYTMQRISIRVSGDEDDHHDLHDHLFWTFATFCCQGSVPDTLYGRTMILGLSKKMLAWLILMTVSSHLVSYMTNQDVQPPFEDVETLINSTDYNIAIYDGSMVIEKFRMMVRDMSLSEEYKSRIWYLNSRKRMYEKGCWGKRKYAVFEAEDRQHAFGRFKCELVEVGQSYFATWVAAGVSKSFKYKRALDIAILKLNEFGLTDGLKDRWLATGIVNPESNVVKSINFDQVMILFGMLSLGMIAAIAIFVIENIVFLYYWNIRKHRSKFNISRSKKLPELPRHLLPSKNTYGGLVNTKENYYWM